MPASTDGTDQSKITLRRAKQLVAGKFSSSSNDLIREDCPPLPHSEELPLSPRSNGSAGSIDCQDSTAVEASSSVQPPEVLDSGGTSSTPSRAVSSTPDVTSSTPGGRMNPILRFGVSVRSDVHLRQGWSVISTAPTYQGLASVVEDANDSDTVVIRPLRLQPGGVGELSTMDDDVIHEVQRNELIFVTSSSRPLTRSLLEKVTNLLTHIGSN
ncbi:hypothetical protein Pmar_PMAR027799 [Perkinsus marinus ATCC 50983]|uniref:Uncharacterized protein n=1 Tax=Perkinsus marinus (strain ATCC 50983 / TXsc) TaxID=423536 RepID=C5KEP2_PERM5|nr:hypothetical protein Pmar_PMAR027799 [Perkinsus marinus ATCC 50983]EER17051.1 hypothetical protein Pmar_PMAR027799 [Perkinsus marinus ATCC 50983]|eukprot:XP_002785255.1 hypothetical protein Pmar_PMAR027799 [Perkinsus marinus ATCC 50983]